MKNSKMHLKEDAGLRTCVSCAYCVKHPFISERSICFNKDSRHFGKVFDENNIDKRWRTEKCHVTPLDITNFL